MIRPRRSRPAGGGRWRPGGLTCGQVRSEAWRWLAADLGAARATKLHRHLAACPHCFSRIEFARVLREVTRRRFGGARAPRELVRRVRALAKGGSKTSRNQIQPRRLR